ncbi:NADH dehydrogenase subunit N [Paraperlucidibaca baekdonensis]|uniref:NADH-quinone oxidoreductase subunit N n=1 Tax=Paraperlucidibaca baekdonensis TaxID=748120 RepID=A0A3E0H8R1_9GAMM|nr:NADH-quinone oxidoreductase subunit NuoN [Paraperlucidibaca baekdonensis]REH39993.1 NADH dehydrogenase subunit N [Paraperlucidibaca baekdonensis]
MTISVAQLIALLPIIITGATAVLVMLSIAIKRQHDVNATITVIGLNAALVSVYFAWQGGPQQVTPLLMIDAHACLYMAIALFATLACATLMHAYIEGYDDNKEEMYLLLTLSVLGALVLISARHLTALFIGLELMSVPVYGLVAYTFRNKRTLEAGIKYMILSAAASAFMLFGMALLYADAGSMLLADIGGDLAKAGMLSPYAYAGIALILAALAFKLSLAPFHLWTPDVYEGAPAPVAAYLATVSKVAVFAVLLRLLIEAPAAHSSVWGMIFAVIAFASMVLGNLLALNQSNIKRLLGYSSIAQLGYLLVVVVAGGQLALEAAAVYLVAYVVTTIGAFGVVTLTSSPYKQQDADALYDYRGLFWRHPYLTAVMTVMMLSLAGIPLTAGFIGKFYVAALGVDAGLWWLVAALVVGSAIGLYYYLRVVITLFMPAPGSRRMVAANNWGFRVGGLMVLLMAGLMFLIGVYPEPLIELAAQAPVAMMAP